MIQLMMYDHDINLSCEVNITSNPCDINAQTTTIEESSNSQAAVESNESDNIKIESYIGPSSKEPGKGVKMSAEFYKYATDKIKKEKQENQVAKENMKDDPQNNVLEQNGNFHFANIRAIFESISSLHAPK